MRSGGAVTRRGLGTRNSVLVSTSFMAQRTAPNPGSFQPTMQDVAPGVDHGNTDDNVPEQFQRRPVFYRSQHPVGTIVIEAAERHLYLIESETRALRYGIGIGRDGSRVRPA